MCLTTPGRIVRIDSPNPDLRLAEVDFGVAVRTVNLLFTADVKVGDFVVAHAGFATRQVSEVEAREALGYWREIDGRPAPASAPSVAGGRA